MSAKNQINWWEFLGATPTEASDGLIKAYVFDDKGHAQEMTRDEYLAHTGLLAEVETVH